MSLTEHSSLDELETQARSVIESFDGRTDAGVPKIAFWILALVREVRSLREVINQGSATEPVGEEWQIFGIDGKSRFQIRRTDKSLEMQMIGSQG